MCCHVEPRTLDAAAAASPSTCTCTCSRARTAALGLAAPAAPTSAVSNAVQASAGAAGRWHPPCSPSSCPWVDQTACAAAHVGACPCAVGHTANINVTGAPKPSSSTAASSLESCSPHSASSKQAGGGLRRLARRIGRRLNSGAVRFTGSQELHSVMEVPFLRVRSVHRSASRASSVQDSEVRVCGMACTVCVHVCSVVAVHGDAGDTRMRQPCAL
eukprot:363169-Chlamydomonas_euryale.AAC.18